MPPLPLPLGLDPVSDEVGNKEGVELDDRGTHIKHAPSLLAYCDALLSQPDSKSWQVEQGVLSTPHKLEIYLLFEQFPIWLLALEAALVAQVCIVGFSSHEDLLTAQRVL